MRALVALLAALWALANLFGAAVLLVNGLTEKTAAKGFIEQSLMLLGGLLVAALACLLLWQAGRLVQTNTTEAFRPPGSEG